MVGDDIKFLSLQVQEKTKIKDLIKMSVNILNENFANENFEKRLNTNYDIYSLKQSKKSGKPNNDLPSFNDEVYVHASQTKQYTLIHKTEPNSQAYIVGLRTEKRESSCKNCMIF
jgi:hypothetical protein